MALTRDELEFVSIVGLLGAMTAVIVGSSYVAVLYSVLASWVVYFNLPLTF